MVARSSRFDCGRLDLHRLNLNSLGSPTNLIVVGKLSICALIGVVEVGWIRGVRSSERVVQLHILLLVSFDNFVMLIGVLQTAIRIAVKELIPWVATLQIFLATQIVVTLGVFARARLALNIAMV